MTYRVVVNDPEDEDGEEDVAELGGDDGLLPVRTDGEMAYKALLDVALWLGFVTTDDYLLALPRECERIFDRARD